MGPGRRKCIDTSLVNPSVPLGDCESVTRYAIASKNRKIVGPATVPPLRVCSSATSVRTTIRSGVYSSMLSQSSPVVTALPLAELSVRNASFSSSNVNVSKSRASLSGRSQAGCMMPARERLCDRARGGDSRTPRARYENAVVRYENRRACVAELDAVFAERSLEEWKDRFETFTG